MQDIFHFDYYYISFPKIWDKRGTQRKKLSWLKEALTRYTNPSAASTMAFIRSIGVVGVVRST